MNINTLSDFFIMQTKYSFKAYVYSFEKIATGSTTMGVGIDKEETYEYKVYIKDGYLKTRAALLTKDQVRIIQSVTSNYEPISVSGSRIP